jgi:hypothetical protein
MASSLIERFGPTGGGPPVDAYIIEHWSDCAVVDSTFTLRDGPPLRARAAPIGKPMLGVAITDTHPDHGAALPIR